MIDVFGDGMEGSPSRMPDSRGVLADAFLEQAEQFGTDVLGPGFVAVDGIGVKVGEKLLKLLTGQQLAK
jgi:hypothetical protein